MIFLVLEMITNFEMSINKLCFAKLHIFYQWMIHLTYYVFIANDYILYFSSNHLTILQDETDCYGFFKNYLKNLVYIFK